MSVFSKKEVLGFGFGVAATVVAALAAYNGNAMYKAYSRCDVYAASCDLNEQNDLTKFYGGLYLKATEPLSMTSQLNRLHFQIEKLEVENREYAVAAREQNVATAEQQVALKQAAFLGSVATLKAKDEAAKLKALDPDVVIKAATASYDGENLIAIVVTQAADGSTRKLMWPMVDGTWGEATTEAASNWQLPPDELLMMTDAPMNNTQQ